MQPPQPPRGPFPGPRPSGNPFGRGGLPGMGVGGPPLPAPTTAQSRGPGPGMGVPGVSAPPASVPLGASASVSEVSRGPSVKYQPQVDYYRRMRKGRLHRLVVRISPEGANGSSPSSIAAGNQTPVTIEPIIPGAVVTPASTETFLRAGGESIFYVLPLVAGKLPEARLDLAIGGRRFTNATLPMRANSGLLARLMLALTVVVTLCFAMIPFNAWEPYRQHYGEKALQEFLRDRIRRLGYSVPEARNQRPGSPAISLAQADETDGDEETMTITWQQPQPTGTQPAVPSASRETPTPTPSVQTPPQPAELRDYLYIALYRAEPLSSKSYAILSSLQQQRLGTLYVLGGMLLLTALCWFVQRPKRVRLQGALLEMKA